MQPVFYLFNFLQSFAAVLQPQTFSHINVKQKPYYKHLEVFKSILYV